MVLDFPITVFLTDLEKFLPEESISIMYLTLEESVAYFGFVHDTVKPTLLESAVSGTI